MITKSKSSISWKNQLIKFLKSFKRKEYAILEYRKYGDAKYVALYRTEKEWKALPNDIPDIVNDLINTKDTTIYKKRIFDRQLNYWKLYDSDKKIHEYIEKYCTYNKKCDAEDSIERHKTFIKYRIENSSGPKIIEYVDWHISNRVLL